MGKMGVNHNYNKRERGEREKMDGGVLYKRDGNGEIG